MNPYAYIVRVEGIGDSNGQTSYCTTVPDYAASDASYVQGLEEPPGGGGSRWDIVAQRMSVGGFTVKLRNGVGPVLLTRTAPKSLTELDGAHNSAVTTIDLKRSYAARAGLANSDAMYFGRETVIIGTIGGTDYQATGCTRGACGSTAFAHPDGADVYDCPPALSGRVVTVHVVQRDAADSSYEVLLKRGQIEKEPKWSLLHGVTLSCVERFGDLRLGDPPVVANDVLWDGDTVVIPRVIRGTYPGTLAMGNTAPRARSDGGYWWLPDQEVVVQGSYSSGNWSIDVRAVIIDRLDVTELEAGTTIGPAYQILCANADLDYRPFGYVADPVGAPNTITRTDHPCDIARNLLLSLDGSNYSGTGPSWDLGDHTTPGTDYGLYPSYSIGVPVAQVDEDSFERAKDGDLAGMRARWFWLGGESPQKLIDQLRALFAPWGYTIGTTRDRVWTLFRLGDVYPGATTTDFTVSSLAEPDKWTSQCQGRALDRVIIECKCLPDGSGGIPITILETDGREHYPPGVGAEVRYEAAPYDTLDLHEHSIAWSLAAARMRRLSERVQFVKVLARRANVAVSTGLLDVGDPVTLLDPGIRDPQTGERLDTSTDDALTGLVVASDLDADSLDNRLTVALMGTGNTARYGPSATVVSWDGGAKKATVQQHDYTNAGDATDPERFTVDDVCVLCESTLEQKAGSSTGVVSDVGTDYLTFAVDDFTVAPAAGNVITWASWDTVVAQQQTQWAYSADGGAPGTDPGLGAAPDDPYVYGD